MNNVFGVYTTESIPFEETRIFTGKVIDTVTGLYHFNARWYDPDLGRFITEDPIKDGTNWYIYANNNPLRFIDPTGLSTLDNFYGKEKPYYHYHSSKLSDIYSSLTKVTSRKLGHWAVYQVEAVHS